MYGKVKLTKKQIKEDKFTHFMLTAKQQVTDSWQYYVIGFVVIVLAISAIVFFVDMQEKQAIEGSSLYSKAVVEYRQKSYQSALLSLQTVLDNHGGTEAAQNATYLSGKINLETQNYPEAIRFFEMYTSKFAADKLKSAASLAGIATALENQGKYDEASTKYEEAIAIDTDGPSAGEYHFDAMRNLLLLGKTDAAKTHYEYIKDNLAGSRLEKNAALLFGEKSKK